MTNRGESSKRQLGDNIIILLLLLLYWLWLYTRRVNY